MTEKLAKLTNVSYIIIFYEFLNFSVELTNQLRDCRAKFLITTPECVIRAKAASEKCDNIQVQDSLFNLSNVI